MILNANRCRLLRALPPFCALLLPGTVEAVDSNGIRLTVIPPGPVTDKVNVELRLAVANTTADAQVFHVLFHWDQEDAAHRIRRQTLRVPPRTFGLARGWWATAGRTGKHHLLYRVESDTTRKTGRRSIRVIASGTRARPILQAAWLDPLGLNNQVYPRDGTVDEQDLRGMMDAMSNLGITTVILTYVEYQGGFFYPSKIHFYDRDHRKIAQGMQSPFDIVEVVLSQADKNAMHVFLGLGRGGDTRLLWEFDDARWNERNRRAIRLGRQVAQELWERYHRHPSLYGWYFTHEMNDLGRASAYYNPLADFCHALSPDKPVLVAPAGTPILDQDRLAASHVDIFAYQDAVGSGYIHYKNTFNPDNRIKMLRKILAGYRQVHAETGKHLWADLEIWEMDGTQGYAGAYPCSFLRLRKQMTIESRYADMLTGYEFSGFMDPLNCKAKLKDKRASRLYRDYAAYVKTLGVPDAGLRRGPPSANP